MRVALYAPPEYWRLSKEEKAKICNGCGGRGGVLNFLIPQKHFEEACNIHDYMYATGYTEEDKRKADATLLYNLDTIVKNMKGVKKWWYKNLAKTFYKAVHNLGDYYFWKGKKFKDLESNTVDV
jgi:hypothetical protein